MVRQRRMNGVHDDDKQCFDPMYRHSLDLQQQQQEPFSFLHHPELEPTDANIDHFAEWSELMERVDKHFTRARKHTVVGEWRSDKQRAEHQQDMENILLEKKVC
jgi:hypothetical protein